MFEIVHLISGGGSTSQRVIIEQRPRGRLHGLVKTRAIICNNAGAGGIRKAIDVGFPKENIHLVSREKGDIGLQLLEVFGNYTFNRFHQLGWLPLTPKNVLAKYGGLNQHLGPGGQYMVGQTRIYTHMRFCETIGVKLPIPVFCQEVALNLDDGDAILVNNVEIYRGETVAEVAERLLPIEHEVQVDALALLAQGGAKWSPVPRVYRTPEERVIMDQLRVEAHEHFATDEEGILNHRFMRS